LVVLDYEPFGAGTVYGKKSFLSNESDTRIIPSIYFTFEVASRHHQLLFK